MSYDPNHRPPWSCPICREWMGGTQRHEHMLRHTRPETAKRIEEATGAPLGEVIYLCLQNGIEIDDLSPDDPLVVEVIAIWNSGDVPPMTEEETDRLVGRATDLDPDIWGDLAKR